MKENSLAAVRKHSEGRDLGIANFQTILPHHPQYVTPILRYDVFQKSQGVHSPEDKPPLFYLGLGEMRRMIMGFKI